ncbi:hypothetical protein BDQ12DRAFT_383740 [Crucibulum laeve]|uniref:Uncharacterized protein n=1 Tax=Crucibulum laeve TaxID=68775 RepID=A0A5C3LNS3_9AGAR|nr:hypothetical protein BDQ12DRAFT_383740 [Crucibulum laeve]
MYTPLDTQHLYRLYLLDLVRGFHHLYALYTIPMHIPFYWPGTVWKPLTYKSTYLIPLTPHPLISTHWVCDLYSCITYFVLVFF